MAFNPDAFLAETPVEAPKDSASGFNPDEFLSQEVSPEQEANQLASEHEALQNKYGTPGQQAKAGLEAVGRGVAGPLFTKFETMSPEETSTLAKTGGIGAGIALAKQVVGDVNPEDIRGREEANPITSAIGTVGGLLTPGGEGALLEKAGARVAEKLAPKIATRAIPQAIAKPAIKLATENALYQMGDETSKMVLNDPNQTAQTAISNTLLAGAIGGVGGGVIGSVSPLWKASFKPKADGILGLLKNKVEGVGLPIDTSIETFLANAEKDGIKISPEVRAGLSSNPNIQNIFRTLRENGLSSSEALIESINQTKDVAQKQISSILGEGGPSAFEAGESAKRSLLGKAEELNISVKDKYGAIGDTATIQIPDESRLKIYDGVIETGQNFGANNSPAQNLFKTYAERILAQDTVGQLDKLNTEIGNSLSMAWRAGDMESYRAMAGIRDMIRDFQDAQIGRAVADVARGSPGQTNKMGHQLEELARVAEHQELAKEVISQRQAARSAYHDFMNKLTDMASMGKAGKIRNYSQFEETIQSIPSAKLASRLFDPKNIEALRALKAEYPEIFAKIMQQQKSDILEYASKQGVLNHNTVLNKINSFPKEVRDIMFDKPELEALESAHTIIRQLNARINPSGTAGTLNKMMGHLPAGVGAVLGSLTGHGAIGGAIVGQIAGFLGSGAPNMLKMALLKFLGSEAPISSTALKSTFDYLNHAYKGIKTYEKAINGIFKGNSKILPDSFVPSQDKRDRLEKRLTELQQNPQDLLTASGEIGYYLPDHAVAIGSTTSNIINFLNSIRPQTTPQSPLDPPRKISTAVKSQYDRALDIAQQPLIVLNSISNGTITGHDIQALNTMYPDLYRGIKQKVMDAMIDHLSKEETVPYSTRMGLSIFLQQPLDSTMKPTSIMAAQPAPKQQPQPQEQGKSNKMSQGAAGNAMKVSKSMQTATQNSESMHSTGKA